MPLPIETLLRVHASPVPAQIVFGACGSIATAPMDCAPSLSNTGLNVVPPFEDFHMPPLAAPTYTVRRPSSFTAAIAATRPLMAAEPMFRAPRPEIVSESNLVFCAGADAANIIIARIAVVTAAKQRIVLLISADSSASKLLQRVLNLIHPRMFNAGWPFSPAALQQLLPSRRRLRLRFGRRHREMRVFQRNILFDLHDRDLRARSTALLRLLNGKRIIDAVHLLVIAEIQFVLLQRATNRGLDFQFQLQVRVRIQIVVAHVAVLHAQFDLEAIRSLHRVVPHQFSFMALLLVIYERPVDVGIHCQAFQVVLRKQFRIFAPAKWRNLPS